MSRRIEQVGRFLFSVPLVLGTIMLLAGSPARAAEETPRVAVLPTTFGGVPLRVQIRSTAAS